MPFAFNHAGPGPRGGRVRRVAVGRQSLEPHHFGYSQCLAARMTHLGHALLPLLYRQDPLA